MKSHILAVLAKADIAASDYADLFIGAHLEIQSLRDDIQHEKESADFRIYEHKAHAIISKLETLQQRIKAKHGL